MTAEVARGVPHSDVDLFSGEMSADPYRCYRELRAVGPVVFLERLGVYVFPRYAEVRAALTDWRGFSSAGGPALNAAMNSAMAGTLPASDPPCHTRMRRLLADVFSPAAQRRRAAAVQARADALVTELVARGSFDAVSELARPFAFDVIGDEFGLSARARSELAGCPWAIFDAFGPEGEQARAGLAGVVEVGVSLLSSASSR